MANDFRSARFWAAELIEGALHEGAIAVDATLGNGHDCLWLCMLVGQSGHVYGFDVQKEAVEASAGRLAQAGMQDRATLLLDGHQHMLDHVQPESADAVMFNLGWLPGAAHGVTTQTQTTLQAVNAALTVLKQEGLLTICIYPGHEEGTREKEALLNWAQKLNEREYDVMLRCYLNQSKDPPLMIAVKKNKRKQK